DRAGARSNDAAEDLHQRRLAGAVLADKAHDLPRRDRKIDRVERPDARVALGNARHDEERVGHAGNLSGSLSDCKCKQAGWEIAGLLVRGLLAADARLQFRLERVDVVLRDDLAGYDDQAVGRNAGLVALEILRHQGHALVTPL